MESLGAKLKSARESKGYTLDYVSKETNIAAKYLEALETEDFTPFPAEPYIRGFIRTYGDYLGLKGEELVSLYRSLKIQEQEVPVKALLQGPSRRPRVLAAALIALAALALGALGAWLFTRIPQDPAASPAAREPEEYHLSAESMERRFYRGDSLLVSLNGQTYKLELTALGEAVTIDTPAGILRLDLGQEATVDLDADGAAELRVVAADFAKNDPAPGALLRFELQTTETAAAADIPAPLAAAAPGATVIFSSPNAYPFTLQAAFQGYCLFRWEVLAEPDRAGRNEQYFQRSAEPLNVQAQNGVRVGASNARAAQLQVIAGGKTYPLELGGAGEVVVADIRWVREAENRYSLVLSRLE